MVGIGTEHTCIKAFLSSQLFKNHLSGPLAAPAQYPTMLESLLSLNCEAFVKGSLAIQFFYPFHRSGFDTDFMVNNDEETGLISYIGKLFQEHSKLMRNCSGKKYTKIQYDQSLYQWNISVANNPRISAVSYSDVSTMVIGTASPPQHQDQNTWFLDGHPI